MSFIYIDYKGTHLSSEVDRIREDFKMAIPPPLPPVFLFDSPEISRKQNINNPFISSLMWNVKSWQFFKYFKKIQIDTVWFQIFSFYRKNREERVKRLLGPFYALNMIFLRLPSKSPELRVCSEIRRVITVNYSQQVRSNYGVTALFWYLI